MQTVEKKRGLKKQPEPTREERFSRSSKSSAVKQH